MLGDSSEEHNRPVKAYLSCAGMRQHMLGTADALLVVNCTCVDLPEQGHAEVVWLIV